MTRLPVRTSGVLGALAVGVSLMAAKARLGEPPPSLARVAPEASGAATAAPQAPTTVPAATASTVPGAASGPTVTTAPLAPAAPAPADAATAPRTITGDLINTEFGDLQVALVIAGGRLVDVQHLAVPEADQESVEINRTAMPELHQQVLAAQGSDIQGVSGATYTSQAYALSVQSTLDRA